MPQLLASWISGAVCCGKSPLNKNNLFIDSVNTIEQVEDASNL
jgi:hypothetical protein